VRAGVDIITDGFDGRQHLRQIAGDGQFIDRILDFPVLDPAAPRE
jgi:hypothetical protein